jgi:hypothetical protein
VACFFLDHRFEGIRCARGASMRARHRREPDKVVPERV